jgi:hypothetical protein
MMRTKSPSAILLELSKEVKAMQDRVAELEMFARQVANLADQEVGRGGPQLLGKTLQSVCRAIGVGPRS